MQYQILWAELVNTCKREERKKKGGPKRESSNEDAVFKKHPAASAEFHLGKKFES